MKQCIKNKYSQEVKKRTLKKMPNIISEELVYKEGKVDIVEQGASKFWNDKIKMLERENKELKEENEIMRTTWLCQADVDEIIFRFDNELKTMKTRCLKSVSKISKKSKELQKEIEELEMRLDATRQVNMCYAKTVSSQLSVEREVQEKLEGLVVSPDALLELDLRDCPEDLRKTARSLLNVKERWIMSKCLSGVFNRARMSDAYIDLGLGGAS